MGHTTNKRADSNLGVKHQVLDHGFVCLVDYMGGDQRIAEAAWVSSIDEVEAEKKTKKGIKRIINYMMANRHCYHPTMQVLTIKGWKQWDECEGEEVFLVPDPKNRTLKRELLQLEVFDADEEMIAYENQRMSFCVTDDHRMWFRPRGQSEFDIFRAHNMSKWGHFDPLKGYHWVQFDTKTDPKMQFIGFYLGDGSYGSLNTITFHIRKERKKVYLRDLLKKVEAKWDERQSSTYSDAVVFTIRTPEWMKGYIDVTLRAKDKNFPLDTVHLLDHGEVIGLYDGLINSDGSEKDDRPQTQFSSSSEKLLDLFEVLSALLGTDAHRTSIGSTAYHGERTSLEARKEYFSKRYYKGKVYCATSSTGLLMVRGGADKFAFVCGNTSPFEQVELVFRARMPIFVARQWVRHRTASLNEMSGRYRLLPSESYVPGYGRMGGKGKSNKQGTEGGLEIELKELIQKRFEEGQRVAWDDYAWLADTGLANELARLNLPLAAYTEWFWKIDLHNFFHFCGLRLHPHAQWEIRQYANKMYELAKDVAPMAFKAFEEHRLYAATLSNKERHAVWSILNGVRGAMRGETEPAAAIDSELLDQIIKKLSTLPQLERTIVDG
jgi:thymidylate synthase (FAD)